MSEAIAAIDRLSPARRPRRFAIGRHTWSNLLFAHWPVPVEVLRPLVPPRLTIDTYDGKAWVALVPFTLSGVRPWWAPSTPGVSAFHETNVRTYVHLDGRDPGVWFFSLDASSSLAVRIARWRWSLPYYRATMQLKCDGSHVHYESRRLWPGAAGYGASIEVDLGDDFDSGVSRFTPGQAAPGTIEHFFCERYILYSAKPDGLYQGYVHHRPYPLRNCRVTRLEEALIGAAGIDVEGLPAHTIYCDGVSVEVFPLKRV